MPENNDRLRAARLRRGWRSQEAAARGVTAAGKEALNDLSFEVAPRTWRRWESAKPGWPREDYATALHAAFGVGPERLGFVAPDGLDLDEDDGVDVSRRTLVAVTAAALTAGPVAPRHVDPALIGYFQQQLEGHYRADMLLGPHDLIGTVSEQYKLIDNLVRTSAGETRRGLLRVGAAYAALVGWLYQDAGDLGAAAFWRGVTQEIALRSRDVHLIGYSLVNHAQVRTDLGDGLGVVDLCEAALEDASGLAPKVRVMALQQQAHGASLLQDRTAVDRLIDEAGGLIGRVDDDLPWGNACRRTPGYLEVQRATCYGRLGLGEEAGALWTQVLAGVPTTARRDRGVYLARHASAAAAARQPDEAVEIAREAATIAVETGSARMRRELGTLERAMRPWQDAPIGRDLSEVLAPVVERG
ncbi:Twin-arginine translocation pathway signal [Streptomyces sp. H10-C2]|uniref:Twin-arginine translocation pathway signal n=1 Tax=unclassified Streptomyces TaxID=2593676 RepID=UPI0024BA1F43|nr:MULTISPECIES: Twin-arginine translocation pathway signal [unclassified Streptomyces]MDJ0345687.1 Twin-arginine translocation pathway signal [Streptomyces sp. PH10-H1]MDJ0374539.1 Twin-arginine translocation pathway signal [Streptomyces sp. H10-C2]